MLDLEDPQEEWEVEEIRDKRKIKDIIHYLIKQAGWPSEYNSYEPIDYLANALDAVAAFERRLKRKKTSDGVYRVKRAYYKDDFRIG